MESPKDSTLQETLSFLKRRMQLCREWRDNVVRDYKLKVISYDEAMAEMDRIDAEMKKTEAAFTDLDEALKKVKIIEKQSEKND